MAPNDLPTSAKGVANDTKAATNLNPSDFDLQLGYDRGETDSNLRVTVASLTSAPAANVYIRVLASSDKQNWQQVRDWNFRLPGGYRIARDYVGSEQTVFNSPMFFLRAELILPDQSVIVREARFVAKPG